LKLDAQVQPHFFIPLIRRAFYLTHVISLAGTVLANGSGTPTVDCGTKFRPTAFVFPDGIADKGTEELKRSAASPEKGNQSCHVVSPLLHPLSLASGASLLFQLTPPHIFEEVLALVALALVASAFIVVAFIVVQRYAVEWR
jgi:hypothetical protein